MLVLASAVEVAAITAGATLLAAGGLAGVTIYTTRQRLAEERGKQKRELSAETDRLAATLAHDRALADIADLRQLLDETATAIDHVSNAQEYAWHCFDMPEAAFKNVAKLMLELNEQLTDAERPLAKLTPRVRLRLGADDPVTASCVEARAAVDHMRDVAFARRIKRDDEERARDRAAEAWGRMLDATQAFFAAAVERAEAARPDQP